jgi:acetyl-CoA carboxylase biotin carboxyl carrier protein
MPDNPTPPTGPFDVTNIHQLVRLMKKYDLTAIDLVEGETKIRLRRRGPEAAAAAAVAAAAGHIALPTASPFPPPAPAPASAIAAPAPAPSTDVVIESPMVGTYYSSPAPDAPPFVTVGSFVRPDATVCVIEAMKVFTDIPAGVSGTITEVLVKNGQPVEFGQPMFRVRPD